MILDRLVVLNFKKDYVLKCINANKHNHATTSYYLLLKKADQEGEITDSQFEYFDEKRIAKIQQ
jgi:5'-AMP-activated protein kinase, catalytic alpha subunit